MRRPSGKRVGVWLAGLVALGLLVRWCLLASYAAESIEAQVVDGETGMPLEGVVVTADWELVGGPPVPLYSEARPVGELQVLEAATDREGRFRFPAWGPKRVRSITMSLEHHDPRLCLLKSGYAPLIVANTVRSGVDRRQVRRSEWNGKVIRMVRAAASSAERLDRLRWFAWTLERFAFSYDTCDWQQVPRMISAFLAEAALFENPERAPSLPNLRHFELSARARRCGSLEEYLRREQ